MSFNNNSKIYLAGHDGLVGTAIFNALLRSGYENIVYATIDELNLIRQDETEKFFEKEQPEYVILAAAKVGGILANDTYKADFIYQNIMIASNVINSSYKFGVKKLLNLGSSCIYPKLAPQPLKEEYLLTNSLEPTNEPYAIAKIAAIKMCAAYNYQYGTQYISVMPTNLYGVNDNYNLETSHVLPALIRKSVLAKALKERDYDFIITDIKRNKIGFGFDESIDLKNIESIKDCLSKIGITNEYIKVWGTGNIRREFLHVDDMADACLYFLKNYTPTEMGDFVNIGTGIDLSIKELARKIIDYVGFKGDIIFDIDKPEGTPQKLLDVSKAKSLGWESSISIDGGIRMTLEDYYNYNL